LVEVPAHYQRSTLNPINSLAPAPLQAIQRALHPAAALTQNMRIDHGRGHVIVAQQFLDRPNVRPSLEGVRREAVPLMPSSA
jgi:hypothetical protein